MTETPDRKLPIKVSRQELFEQVWDQPMIKLGAHYGVSGNGLAKICDRMDVPYPPRGYWAKKAAGKKVKQSILPPSRDGTPSETWIRPSAPLAKTADISKDILEKAEVVRVQLAAAPIPQKLSRPHPIVAAWVAAHAEKVKRARETRDQFSWSYAPKPFNELDRRIHRIYDSLFKSLERHGGRISQEERGSLVVQVLGEDIKFSMRLKQKRSKEPTTRNKLNLGFYEDQQHKTSLTFTGKLSFKIETYLPPGNKTEWLETDEEPMEKLLPEIIAAFITIAPQLVEQTRMKKEAEEKHHAEEARRYQEQRAAKLNANRFRTFNDLAKRWEAAKIAREFLNALKAMESNRNELIGGITISDWIIWLEAEIEKSDPLNDGLEYVLDQISKVTEWSFRD